MAASDIADIARKMAALEIIFSCPTWPQREKLSDTGQALYDAIMAEGKTFALNTVDCDLTSALAILGRWSAPFNTFIDNTMISGNEAAEQMVRCFCIMPTTLVLISMPSKISDNRG